MTQIAQCETAERKINKQNLENVLKSGPNRFTWSGSKSTANYVHIYFPPKMKNKIKERNLNA